MSEKGADFADNQAYFKRITSHSGAFVPRADQNPSHTGRTVAVTGKTLAQTGRTQRISSGNLPPVYSQRIPKPSNTIMLSEDDIKKIKQSKYLSIILGALTSLMLVVLLAIGVWMMIAPNDRAELDRPTYSITETEIKWNTEHTEKL